MADRNPVRAAIFQRLAADSTLVGLLARPPRGRTVSIYHRAAPLGARFPYVIFNAQDPDRPTWTFQDGRHDTSLWLVKAICEGDDASPAEAVADAVDVVLNGAPLTVAGRRLLDIRRQSGVDYGETRDADQYHHVGGVYRVVTEPA